MSAMNKVAPEGAKRIRRPSAMVALAGLMLGSSERRRERRDERRAREMELEIARLRAVGGC